MERSSRRAACPLGHRGPDVAPVKIAALRGYHPAPATGRPTDSGVWNRLYYCYVCALPFDPRQRAG